MRELLRGQHAAFHQVSPLISKGISMSERAAHSSRTRRRFTPLALITGAVGVILLSLSVTGSLSGFTASITNNTNTAASGSLVMQEQATVDTVTTTCLSTDNGSVSTNSATCSTINKFGGSKVMVPGGPAVVTAITIKNLGTIDAKTFTLTPGATCTQSTNGSLNGTATDLCTKINVVITSGATTVFTGTAASLAGALPAALTMPAAPAAGATIPFTISVTLNANSGNSYQGLAASLPLTWTFAN